MSDTNRNTYNEVDGSMNLDGGSQQEEQSITQEEPKSIEQQTLELEESMSGLDAWRNEIKEREARGEAIGDERQELERQERDYFEKAKELGMHGIRLQVSPEMAGVFLKYMQEELNQKSMQNQPEQHETRKVDNKREQNNQNNNNPYQNRQEVRGSSRGSRGFGD